MGQPRRGEQQVNVTSATPIAAWHLVDPNPRRAGSRYRCLYPMEELCRQGFAVELFDPARERAYGSVVFNAWNLFPTVSEDCDADKIMALASRLKRAGTRIVLDNCDNQFAAHEAEPAWLRGLARLRELSKMADTLVVCSATLAEAMRAHTGFSGEIRVIGDPIEKSIFYPGDSVLRSWLSLRRKASWLLYARHRFAIAADQRQGRTPLVWFGSHGNAFTEAGMLDLLRRREMLESLNRLQPVSLTVISNHRSKFAQHFGDWMFPTHYLEWDRLTFLAALRLHTISLIPAQLNDFTRCKSANRLILSLAHGLATVADPIPSYAEFSGVSRLGDGEHGLAEYLTDAGVRKRDIDAGRQLIEARYSLTAIAAQWGQALFPARSSELLVDSQQRA